MIPSSDATNPLSNIMLISIKGFKEQLSNFSPELGEVPVVLVASDTHLRTLIRAKKEIKYPFFAMKITTVEKKTDGYNAFALSRRSLSIAKNNVEDNQTDVMFNLIPMMVSVNIKFLSNSIDAIYNFCQRWNLCTQNNLFDFRVEVEEEAPINVRVVTEISIAYPDLEMEELGETSVTETTAIIHTYTGTVNRYAKVVGSRVNVNVLNSQNNVTFKSFQTRK